MPDSFVEIGCNNPACGFVKQIAPADLKDWIGFRCPSCHQVVMDAAEYEVAALALFEGGMKNPENWKHRQSAEKVIDLPKHQRPEISVNDRDVLIGKKPYRQQG
jgi:hypothetical protein